MRCPFYCVTPLPRRHVENAANSGGDGAYINGVQENQNALIDFTHCSLSFLLSFFFLICPLSLILSLPKTIQLYVLQQLQVVLQQLSLVLWLLNTMIELSLGSDPKVSLLFPVIHSLVLFGCNSPTSTESMMLSWKTLRNMMLSPCKVFL